MIACFAILVTGQASAQNKINGVVKDQNGALIVAAQMFPLNVQIESKAYFNSKKLNRKQL